MLIIKLCQNVVTDVNCSYSTAQKYCTRKKWHKKFLHRKNTQATARSKNAVFLQFTHKNF